MWFRNVLFQRTLSNGVRPNIGFVVKRAKQQQQQSSKLSLNTESMGHPDKVGK